MTGDTGAVSAIAFTPDGRTLATASKDYTAALWNIANPQQPTLLATLPAHSSPLTGVAISPDGRTLATTSEDHTAALWDITDPQRLTRTAIFSGFLATGPFSPDLHTLIARTTKDATVLWDTSSPSHPVQAATLPGTYSGAVFSPDGHSLAIDDVYADHPEQVWEVTHPRRPLRLGTLLPSFASAFSPNGNIIIDAPNTGAPATVWDVTDPRRPTIAAKLPTQNQNAESTTTVAIAFNRNGNIAATINEADGLTLWEFGDPYHPEPITTLADIDSLTRELDVSPTGQLLVSGGDRYWTLWDISNPRQPMRAALIDANSPPSQAAFSADGRTLAVGGRNGNLTAWDITNPTRPVRTATLAGHTERFTDIRFSPDGHTLATANWDGTAVLWDSHWLTSASGHLTDWACAAAGTSLTPQNWQTHAPAAWYSNTC